MSSTLSTIESFVGLSRLQKMKSVFILFAICIVGSKGLQTLEKPSNIINPQGKEHKNSTTRKLSQEGRNITNENEDSLKIKDESNKVTEKWPLQDSPHPSKEKVDYELNDFEGFLDDELNNYQQDAPLRKYGGYQSLLSPAGAFVTEANEFVKSLDSRVLKSELTALEKDYLDPDFLIQVYYVEPATAVEVLENLLQLVFKLLRGQNQKNEEQKYMGKTNAKSESKGSDKNLADDLSKTQSSRKTATRNVSNKRGRSENLKARTKKLKQLDEDIQNLTDKAFKIAKLVNNMEKLTRQL